MIENIYLIRTDYIKSESFWSNQRASIICIDVQVV